MQITTRVERGRAATRVLVLLHGLGGDEHDLAAIVPTLDPDGRFVSVLARGPYPAFPDWSHGAWYMYVPPERTIETLNACVAALDEAIASTCAAHAMRPEDVVIGGFSQGGATAIAYAFGGRAIPPSAAFSVAGVPPRGSIIADDAATRVRIMHGHRDADTPLTEAEEFAGFLKDRGVTTEFVPYDAGHEFNDEMASDVARWLAAV